MAETITTTISGLDSSVKIGGREDPGNILVRNTGTVPVPNFSFMLRVEGIFDLPCKAISGISRENQFDYIQEGGLNDYVHLRRKAISQPFKFQVERYVGVNWVDPLPLGTELVLPVILFVNKGVYPTFQPVRTYTFTGCTVISKDYGDMNAEASGLLVEKVTIAYREMICLDIPSETFEGKTWGFDGKKKEGTGERHYNTNLYNGDWEKKYSSKAEMEKRAAKYAHSKTATRDGSAKYNKDELSKTDMEMKAAKWVPEKNNVKPKYGKDYGSMVEDFNKSIEKQLKEMEELAERDLEAEKALRDTLKSTGGVTKRKYTHSEKATRNGSAKYNNSKLELTAAEMKGKAEAAKWVPEKNNVKPKYGKDYGSMVEDFNKSIEKQLKEMEELAERDLEAEKALRDTLKSTGGVAKREYTHSEKATRNGSAKYNKDEPTKEVMINSAAKWVPEKNNVKPKYGKDYGSMVEDFNKAIDEEIKNASTPKEKEEAEGKKIATGGIAKRTYTHSENATRNGSATYNKELSKASMIESAKVWPEDSSAHIEKMTKPEPRLWPKDSSAHIEKMTKPKSRLWPKKKSAKQITDFLKKK